MKKYYKYRIRRKDHATMICYVSEVHKRMADEAVQDFHYTKVLHVPDITIDTENNVIKNRGILDLEEILDLKLLGEINEKV